MKCKKREDLPVCESLYFNVINFNISEYYADMETIQNGLLLPQTTN